MLFVIIVVIIISSNNNNNNSDRNYILKVLSGYLFACESLPDKDFFFSKAVLNEI